MKIAIASDHAGFSLKSSVVKAVAELGHQAIDLGTTDLSSVDYPDYAGKVAQMIESRGAELGVLVCGSGIGMSIAANRHRRVRAAVCTNEFEARMARAHNNANVLCMGERVIGPGTARGILEVFLSTPFEGGRHQRRIDKL